ncbi:MAG TPA: histidine triad nucleotide-binding protein [Longimicrobium sp.]
MSDCIFCRIVAGEIPSPRVLEGDDWIAIRDINPAAPVHVLVIPRRHVVSVAELGDGDGELAGRLLLAVRDVARHEGVAESGYRTVINTGPQGGQTVAHLHVHVMGGRQLSGHGTA